MAFRCCLLASLSACASQLSHFQMSYKLDIAYLGPSQEQKKQFSGFFAKMIFREGVVRGDNGISLLPFGEFYYLIVSTAGPRHYEYLLVFYVNHKQKKIVLPNFCLTHLLIYCLEEQKNFLHFSIGCGISQPEEGAFQA